MIRTVQDDLFASIYHPQALAHGCNLQGAMGAGIAVQFKARYPAMYAEYHRRCKAVPRQFNLGDAFLWKCDDLPWVFNLGTQEDFWRSKATYSAVAGALMVMRRTAISEGITSIAMPRIGCGYGGLSWPQVNKIVKSIFDKWSGMLFIYEGKP